MQQLTNTYKTIETETITAQIEHILTGTGVEYTKAYKYRPGTVSNTQHCIVYSLVGFDDYRLVGDRVTPQIYVFNSYKKESAFMLSVGFLRWVCSNGMVAGTDLFTTRIVHRVGQTADQKLAAISDGLISAIHYIKEGLQLDIQKLGSQELTLEQGAIVLETLPVPKRAKIDAIDLWNGVRSRRLADQTNTVWALWNIVNECMRTRARSEVRNLEYNRDLLNHIVNRVDHELLEVA